MLTSGKRLLVFRQGRFEVPLALERATKIDMNVDSLILGDVPAEFVGIMGLGQIDRDRPRSDRLRSGRWGGRRIGFLPGRICLAARGHVAVHRCSCGYPPPSQGEEPCAKSRKRLLWRLITVIPSTARPNGFGRESTAMTPRLFRPRAGVGRRPSPETVAVRLLEGGEPVV